MIPPSNAATNAGRNVAKWTTPHYTHTFANIHIYIYICVNIYMFSHFTICALNGCKLEYSRVQFVYTSQAANQYQNNLPFNSSLSTRNYRQQHREHFVCVFIAHVHIDRKLAKTRVWKTHACSFWRRGSVSCVCVFIRCVYVCIFANNSAYKQMARGRRGLCNAHSKNRLHMHFGQLYYSL